jgi:hypothetical protein
MAILGPVARKVTLPGTYGRPNGARPRASADATHRTQPAPL